MEEEKVHEFEAPVEEPVVEAAPVDFVEVIDVEEDVSVAEVKVESEESEEVVVKQPTPK